MMFGGMQSLIVETSKLVIEAVRARGEIVLIGLSALSQAFLIER
jgi:hypothetical protein